jgi:hypothetical protein
MAIREICATIAGALYAIGWWVFIDAHLYQSRHDLLPVVYAYYYIPAAVATVGLFL